MNRVVGSAARVSEPNQAAANGKIPGPASPTHKHAPEIIRAKASPTATAPLLLSAGYPGSLTPPARASPGRSRRRGDGVHLAESPAILRPRPPAPPPPPLPAPAGVRDGGVPPPRRPPQARARHPPRPLVQPGTHRLHSAPSGC